MLSSEETEEIVAASEDVTVEIDSDNSECSSPTNDFDADEDLSV